MQEDFLHYVWKYKKIELFNLQTACSKPVELLSCGIQNHNSGPDFFNAKISIDSQVWAGNVEIHVKSSDWYLHNHEEDSNYDNVILHVVWEDDAQVFRKDNTIIPTIELKKYILPQILSNYNNLLNRKQSWINCENDFAKTDDFVLDHWLERLYLERLERKSKAIEDLLITSKNNWEEVLFKMLTKNFGLKVNADAFLSLANSIEFSIIQKTQSNLLGLNALFYGQAGLLDKDIDDRYYLDLKNEYGFFKQKFQLSNDYLVPVQFFRLRPSNFPTIRLSQLANLYHKQQNLFSKILKSETLEDFYTLFKVTASPYWDTHYTFQNRSKSNKKTLSNSFIDLLLINTVIPIKFCFAKQKGETINHHLLDIIRAIKPENNSIVKKYSDLRKAPKSALESQALVQLKTEYCNKHQCLNCAIGNSLLNK